MHTTLTKEMCVMAISYGMLLAECSQNCYLFFFFFIFHHLSHFIAAILLIGCILKCASHIAHTSNSLIPSFYLRFFIILNVIQLKAIRIPQYYQSLQNHLLSSFLFRSIHRRTQIARNWMIKCKHFQFD